MLNPTTQEDIDELNNALNPYFQLNGYSSIGVIENLGSTSVFLGIFFMIHILALLLRLLSNASARFEWYR